MFLSGARSDEKEKERRRHQDRGVSSFRAASILSASVEATRMRAPFGMRFRRCLLDLSCANALAMLSGAVIRAGLGNSTLPVEVGTRRQSSQVQLGMFDTWRFFYFRARKVGLSTASVTPFEILVFVRVITKFTRSV